LIFFPALFSTLLWILFPAQTGEPEDPYAVYLRASRDFETVRQDEAWLLEAWPGWFYMPWPYRWAIGYNEKSGRWCVEHGYNGAQLDFGRTEVGGADKLAWIERFGLRFYVDHVAGKGDLFLWDPDEVGPFRVKIASPGVRPVPIDDALRKRLEERITRSLAAVKGSPCRLAYALDDEPSWGYLDAPCRWRVRDDAKA